MSNKTKKIHKDNKKNLHYSYNADFFLQPDKYN